MGRVRWRVGALHRRSRSGPGRSGELRRFVGLELSRSVPPRPRPAAGRGEAPPPARDLEGRALVLAEAANVAARRAAAGAGRREAAVAAGRRAHQALIEAMAARAAALGAAGVAAQPPRMVDAVVRVRLLGRFTLLTVDTEVLVDPAGQQCWPPPPTHRQDPIARARDLLLDAARALRGPPRRG